MNYRDWNLDRDQFGIPKAAKPRTASRDTGSGTPVRTLPVGLHVFGLTLATNIVVAFGLPLTLLIGTLLYASRYMPEIIVASFPLGFGIGVYLYFRNLMAHERDKDNWILAALNLDFKMPTAWLIAGWTILTPTILFVVCVLTVWGSNRFLAAVIPATFTGYLFIRFGHAPIKFFEQLLLSQPEMPPDAKTTLAMSNHRPNVELLVAILVGIVAVPILVSNTVAILLLVLGLTAVFLPYVSTLLQAAPNGALILYLLEFSYKIVDWFVNYPEAYASDRPHEDLEQWAPPFALTARQGFTCVLMASLNLTLIVCLSYYCPWEFFAKLTTDLPYDVTNNPTSALPGYEWLFAPFTLASSADPLALYGLCFVFGVLGFVLLPPAILLAIYLPRIIELEAIHQELKKYRSTARQ